MNQHFCLNNYMKKLFVCKSGHILIFPTGTDTCEYMVMIKVVSSSISLYNFYVFETKEYSVVYNQFSHCYFVLQKIETVSYTNRT